MTHDVTPYQTYIMINVSVDSDCCFRNFKVSRTDTCSSFCVGKWYYRPMALKPCSPPPSFLLSWRHPRHLAALKRCLATAHALRNSEGSCYFFCYLSFSEPSQHQLPLENLIMTLKRFDWQLEYLHLKTWILGTWNSVSKVYFICGI